MAKKKSSPRFKVAVLLSPGREYLDAVPWSVRFYSPENFTPACDEIFEGIKNKGDGQLYFMDPLDRPAYYNDLGLLCFAEPLWIGTVESLLAL